MWITIAPFVTPEAGKEFRRGDKVIIVCRLSGSRWLGELNPWPDVL
ncbi:hypothetical protein A8674_004357 [Escherichia coli]|nr:hypothetical protein [Escherichia coli]MBZ9374603.1 hypothetical protein [Escherichia coli]